MIWRLIQIENGNTRLFELGRKISTIGSHPDNHVILDDVSVSAKHAEIIRDDQSVLIRRLQSDVILKVNDLDVIERELENGDLIQIGNFHFLIRKVVEEPEILLGSSPQIEESEFPQESGSFSTHLADLGLSAYSQTKKTARLTALKARIEKLKRVDLTRAHRSLAESCFSSDRCRESFPEEFQKITELKEKIRSKLETVTNAEGATLSHKVKNAASNIAGKAEAEALRVSLSKQLTILGSAIASSNLPDLDDLLPDVTKVRQAITAAELEYKKLGEISTDLGSNFMETMTDGRKFFGKKRKEGKLGRGLLLAIGGLGLIVGTLVINNTFFKSNSNSGWVGGDTSSLMEASDRLSAHPEDPAKPSGISGVTDAQLQDPDGIEKAALACIAAVDAFPDDARQRFQLGRVLALGGMMEEAREHLQIAADLGHGAAMAYLGMIEEDGSKAADWFEKSASAGFKPAAIMHKQLIAAAVPDFAAQEYNNPKLMQAFYEQDKRYFDSARPEIIYAVRSMSPVFQQNCPLLHDPAITAKLLSQAQETILGGGTLEEQGFKALEGMLRQYANPEQLMKNIVSTGVDHDKAEQDAVRLLSNYGCDDEVTKRVYAGMIAFLDGSPDKNSSQSEILPLHKKNIYGFAMGFVSSIYDVPSDQRDAVQKQISKIMASDQQVMVCSYGPSDPIEKTGFVVYEFWYKNVPSNLDSLVEGVPKHPLRHLGFKAITEAPKDSEEAFQLIQSFRNQ